MSTYWTGQEKYTDCKYVAKPDTIISRQGKTDIMEFSVAYLQHHLVRKTTLFKPQNSTAGYQFMILILDRPLFYGLDESWRQMVVEWDNSRIGKPTPLRDKCKMVPSTFSIQSDSRKPINNIRPKWHCRSSVQKALHEAKEKNQFI